MEAERNLHTFHEFPESATLGVADRRPLWAGLDGRARYGLRTFVLLVLGQAYARTRTAPTRARHAVDFRNIGIGGRRRESLRRIRHHEWRACGGEDVLFFTGVARGQWLGIHCMRWVRDECGGRPNGNGNCE